MDLNKLKVADLKAELAARNLDTKGVKAVLLERLKEAIERETNAASNIGSSDQQLQQQQRSLPQQQLQLQQQLFVNQQEQQLLLLQHQQQQQPNVTSAEVCPQPQEQAIEDLSMPTNRNDTSARRRSTRRSMTRSPSPTNTTGEKANEALMGSARKRGRSRSMTKSPSPQRLISEAPALASVQEEPEHITLSEERLAGAIQTTEDFPVPIRESMTEKAKGDSASTVEDIPQTLLVLAPLPELKQQDEPSNLLTMEVDNNVLCDESAELLEKDDGNECTENKSEKDSTELSETITPDAKSMTETASHIQVKAVDNNDKKASSDEKLHDEETKTKSETTTNHKPKSDVLNLPEKKQTMPQQTHNTMIEFVSEENEPIVAHQESDSVVLSWYDSDLNLMIDDKNLLSAKPLSDGIFGLVWAGVRATRGVLDGKVLYEVLIEEELQSSIRSPLIPDGENPTPEIRIGWSIAVEGVRQLGETDLSFGYANCGKKVVSGNFEEYGVIYGKNDVVGVYLDMESIPCRMEFTVNRVRQGEAFQFNKESLQGKALFPTVYSKNMSFKMNFGTIADGFPLNIENKELSEEQTTENVIKAKNENSLKDEHNNDETASSNEEDVKTDKSMQKEIQAVVTESSGTESVPFDVNYQFLDRFMENTSDQIQKGPNGPLSRDCCELITMIGLPGSGKTHWVAKYLKENSTNPFTVLSVDSLMDNMKVAAKQRDPSNTPQWEKIVNQLSRNMTRIIEIACKRRRNFIIDQTNVFASEQKRRLKGFGGFKTRRAVAVIPNIEEYKRRYEEKVAKYGKEVPDTTLNTMKANMFVPSLQQNWYTDILFPELAETEAQVMIKKLNEEGRKLMPPRRNRANQSARQKYNNNANSNYTSRWNHNRTGQGGQQQYGKNRYGGAGSAVVGGYNRYGGHKSNEGTQSYGHNRTGDYRSSGGNGYGRRDEHHHRGGNYGGNSGNRHDSWNRNSGGYYNDRGYSNRGFHQQQDHSNNRYDARRRDRRGYNNTPGWNGQGGQSQQQWNNYPKSGSSDSWYLWWQSNLPNLLGPNGSVDATASSTSWNQYNNTQHRQSSSYASNYHSKSSGAGAASNNFGSGMS